MFKKILIIIAIIFISGLSGILADRYLFPYLATNKLFSKWEFLRIAKENVTVINKTEQVYVKEESSAGRIASQITPAVVNILSYNQNEKIFKNGTGTIVTSDGMIITYSDSLIFDSKGKVKYKVFISEGSVFDGELVFLDSWSNLAFLRISATNLPVVTLADSDERGAGEKIVAIGNDMPRYQNRFLAGVLEDFDPDLNVLGQSVSNSEKLNGLFALDFSGEKIPFGGPAVDYSAQAVGIIGQAKIDNKTKAFVIPANKLKKVIEKAIEKEKAEKTPLGIYYVNLSPSFALANGLSQNQGAYIYSSSGQEGLAILSGSLAQKSGFRLYDIITRVNGEEITALKSLSNLLYGLKKGDKVEFMVMRGGNEIKIPVVF